MRRENMVAAVENATTTGIFRAWFRNPGLNVTVRKDTFAKPVEVLYSKCFLAFGHASSSYPQKVLPPGHRYSMKDHVPARYLLINISC